MHPRMANRLLTRPAIALVLTLITLPPAPAAPRADDDYRLRTDTHMVEVDVHVRDAKGNPVRGLRPADFTIVDNGKKRPFTEFREESNASNGSNATTADDASASPSATQPPLPPNTFTNLGAPKAPSSHSTVLLLDAVNGWADNYAYARHDVADLLARVPSDEKLAVYVIVKQMGLVMLQDYTTDHARILAALDAFIPQGMRPAPPSAGDNGEGLKEPLPVAQPGGNAVSNSPSADVSLAMRKAQMAAALARSDDLPRAAEQIRLSLKSIAAQLAAQPGRKSIYWFTQGLPSTVLWGDGVNNTMDKAWSETIASLNDANIAVNTVDNNGVGGPKRFWGRGTVLMQKMLAEETGGKSYYYRNDPGALVAQDIADSRAVYVLGFYLDKIDGAYHTLHVTLNKPNAEKRGYELTYRQGYVSRDEFFTEVLKGKGAELETLLMNPSNVSDLGLTAKLNATPGNPVGRLNVSLNLRPERLSLTASLTGWTGHVDELFIEFNAAGREVARLSATGHFNVPADAKDAFAAEGATLAQNLQLAPDAAKLAIIVRDTSSGRVGSLAVPLTQPAAR